MSTFNNWRAAGFLISILCLCGCPSREYRLISKSKAALGRASSISDGIYSMRYDGSHLSIVKGDTLDAKTELPVFSPNAYRLFAGQDCVFKDAQYPDIDDFRVFSVGKDTVERSGFLVKLDWKKQDGSIMLSLIHLYVKREGTVVLMDQAPIVLRWKNGDLVKLGYAIQWDMKDKRFCVATKIRGRPKNLKHWYWIQFPVERSGGKGYRVFNVVDKENFLEIYNQPRSTNWTKTLPLITGEILPKEKDCYDPEKLTFAVHTVQESTSRGNKITKTRRAPEVITIGIGDGVNLDTLVDEQNSPR